MDQQHDVVVIGAGQAGLATGYHLRDSGADFVMIEAGQRVGDGWRKYWDSLRLFSPARYDHLPGLPFPGDPCRPPHKDEVGDYLAEYAVRFDLPVRCGERVTRVRRDNDGFDVQTGTGGLRAKAVVVATGSHGSPVVPEFAAQLDPEIAQLTVTEYRNPTRLSPGDVLVVGAGNSGVQIAMEIAENRTTWLAGPDTGRLPRRILHRDLFAWIELLGVMRWKVDSAMGRRIVASRQGRGDPVLGLRARDIEASGVRRAPRVVGVEGGVPRLADGRLVSARTIVWCCGMRPDFSWIEGLQTDEHGNPRHVRGRAQGIDGLFFMGLRFQSRVGSDLLGSVGIDAKEICAAAIERVIRVDRRRAA